MKSVFKEYDTDPNGSETLPQFLHAAGQKVVSSPARGLFQGSAMNLRLNTLLVMPFAVLLAVSTAASGADAFDKPLAKQVVKLPADPDNPQAKPKRSCFSYPGFMVKEVDLGEVGADLSITPITKAGQRPSCDAMNAGEIAIKGDDWSGYFAGVKGDFVFFTAGDGVNGGMPFAVFSAKNGKKLFEESAGTELFRFIALSGDGMTLLYRRVFKAPCSLYADPKGCWRKIMAVTLLEDTARPDCTGAYQKEMKRTPKFAKSIPALPTIVRYNVEARYSGGKLTFTPLDKRAECWLED
jgi:hypothetical protein